MTPLDTLKSDCITLSDSLKEVALLIYTKEFFNNGQFNNAKFMSYIADREKELEIQARVHAATSIQESADAVIEVNMDNLSIGRN
jgi:hypothetical protein